MLKCITIDDEPLARECIVNYIREIDFLELAGTGNNPIEVTKLLEGNGIDLIFLDIEMPLMNGLDFLKSMQNPPMVIITTAYPSYALEGFQLDVIDYLVKPITFTRFFKAVSKAKDYHHLKTRKEKSSDLDYFFIKCEYKYERIYLEEILFVQALQNYVVIQTSRGKFMTLLSLKNVEEKLPSQSFIRVHKSYIVAVAKIDSIENAEIQIQSFRIPISRSQHEEVLGRVVNDRLWKKE